MISDLALISLGLVLNTAINFSLPEPGKRPLSMGMIQRPPPDSTQTQQAQGTKSEANSASQSNSGKTKASSPLRMLLVSGADGDKPPDDWFYDWLKQEKLRLFGEQEASIALQLETLFEILKQIVESGFSPRGKLYQVIASAQFYTANNGTISVHESSTINLSSLAYGIQQKMLDAGYSHTTAISEIDIYQAFINQSVISAYVNALLRNYSIEQIFRFLFFMEYRTQIDILRLVTADMTNGQASRRLTRAIITGIGGEHCKACRDSSFIDSWRNTMNRELFPGSNHLIPIDKGFVQSVRVQEMSGSLNRMLSISQKMRLLTTYHYNP